MVTQFCAWLQELLMIVFCIRLKYKKYLFGVSTVAIFSTVSIWGEGRGREVTVVVFFCAASFNSVCSVHASLFPEIRRRKKILISLILKCDLLFIFCFCAPYDTVSSQPERKWERRKKTKKKKRQKKANLYIQSSGKGNKSHVFTCTHLFFFSS